MNASNWKEQVARHLEDRAERMLVGLHLAQSVLPGEMTEEQKVAP